MLNESKPGRDVALQNLAEKVRKATSEDWYEFFLHKFNLGVFTPTLIRRFGVNHYEVTFNANIAICGAKTSSYRFKRKHYKFSDSAIFDCRKCQKVFVNAMVKYLHLNVFPMNPEDPLKGFAELNEAALKKTENYSEDQLARFVTLQSVKYG